MQQFPSKKTDPFYRKFDNFVVKLSTFIIILGFRFG